MKGSSVAAAFLILSLLVLGPGTAGASNPPSISSVNLGTVPRGVAVDATSGLLYVLLYLNGTTLVVSSSTLATVAHIATPSPYAVAVNSGTGRAYVSQGQGASIVVIKDPNNVVSSSIAGAGTPYALAVDQNAGLITAADTSENTLWVIDGSTNAVIGHLRMGDTSALAVDSGTHEAFIGNLSSNGQGGTVEAVNLTSLSVVKTVSIPISPDHFALDPTSHSLFVSSGSTSNGANLLVLDDRTLAVTYSAEIGNSLGVMTVGLSPDVYVSDVGANRLYELNGNGDLLLNSTGDGKSVSFTGITAMAFDTQNGALYLTENDVTSLIVVSPATMSSSFSAIGYPYLVAFSLVLALTAMLVAASTGVRNRRPGVSSTRRV